MDECKPLVWGGEYDGVYLVKACALNKVANYAQSYDGSTCMEPPPHPHPLPSLALAPPPFPPPPSNDVCSKDSMVVGCKCASEDFSHGKPDNPSSTSPLCCDKATRKTVTGAQITLWVTCVKYSPPPRPPAQLGRNT